ncbi:hypothetical protein QA640_45820 (plasmid) [Bradyrhizobium sp. CB82]|uniref:hypothetical protein n=1 Tax=Bradyrhizobium sp. CB82 TaxID=3039159 RepID=UPI0024B04EB3|nr:hypothetical protein [Bradyrhizobium sp. CB82]WFU46080.1 hypothetical protein QA640_45820 [Bradyrhizobium sp. CB82]
MAVTGGRPSKNVLAGLAVNMVKVIGLTSGSSFDGIDVVAVEIENGPDVCL